MYIRTICSKYGYDAVCYSLKHSSVSFLKPRVVVILNHHWHGAYL